MPGHHEHDHRDGRPRMSHAWKICMVPHPERPGLYCTAPLRHDGDHHGLAPGSDWPNLSERGVA